MRVKCDSYDKNKCKFCVYLEHVDEKGLSTYPDKDWEDCVRRYDCGTEFIMWTCSRSRKVTWTKYDLEYIMKEIIKKEVRK
jgi:hypothetical protein